jgi:hypothetical protein
MANVNSSEYFGHDAGHLLFVRINALRDHRPDGSIRMKCVKMIKFSDKPWNQVIPEFDNDGNPVRIAEVDFNKVFPIETHLWQEAAQS